MAEIETGTLFTDKFDADKAIEKLIEAEKSKADKWENEKFVLELRRKAYVGLSKKLSEIKTAASNLYNPVTSPFKKMKTKSSDENVLTADASSKVKVGDYEFKVIQMASNEIFRTNPIPRDTKIPELQFSIIYKDKTYNFNFKGGSLDAFSKYLNEAAKNILTSSIIKVDDASHILTIEGKDTGENSNIVFKGNLESLENIGLLYKYTYGDVKIDVTNTLGLGSNKPVDQIIRDGSLYLSPLTEAEKILSTPAKGGKNIYLKFKFKIDKYVPPESEYKKALEGKVGYIDKVWVGDVDIEGEYLLTDPDFGKEEKKISGGQYLLIINYQRNEEVASFLYDSTVTDWQDISIELKDDYVNRLSFRNPFTNKEIWIKDVIIVDENKKGYVPKNRIKEPKDAIVEYKGVKVIRPENIIKDIVDGMTLNIKGVSDKPVNINVDWDLKGIKDKVMELVIMYNNAMDYIKNVTKAIPPKNQKELKAYRESFKNIDKKELEEKDKTGELYEGVLNGDLTVSSIKTKIREVIKGLYKTRDESLMFLSQIGIDDPKYTTGGTEEERENLRAGYLNFDENKFDQVLKSNYEALTDIFFRDTNGDLLYDDGVAVKLNETLNMIASDSFRGSDGRVYPGMIKSRLNMLDSSIALKVKEIEAWDRHVKDYEIQIRKKFAKMYEAFQKSKVESQRIKGFSNKE
ncbi:MAG TPA: flagellar filament capping protein FliD [Spirochaetota bacterium]|nr:flagellar filament capping protein FliD [Spirochaetota bacterium]HOM37535.1 flagellar filament capping protein FliD [Spirochaetota bacterium]HPQ49493.1 flagellar filament capping protein FliD [Spirochaetota bacterium]